MSRETIMTDEDGVRYSYENIKTQGWLDGHYSGLDAAVNYIKDKATELFNNDKYDKAIELRKLAEELVKKLEPEMRKRANDHERDYPAIVTDEDG